MLSMGRGMMAIRTINQSSPPAGASGLAQPSKSPQEMSDFAFLKSLKDDLKQSFCRSTNFRTRLGLHQVQPGPQIDEFAKLCLPSPALLSFLFIYVKLFKHFEHDSHVSFFMFFLLWFLCNFYVNKPCTWFFWVFFYYFLMDYLHIISFEHICGFIRTWFLCGFLKAWDHFA